MKKIRKLSRKIRKVITESREKRKNRAATNLNQSHRRRRRSLLFLLLQLPELRRNIKYIQEMLL